MKILVCAGDAPVPPFDGLSLVVHQLVEGLRERHEVRVVALADAPDRHETSGLRMVGRPPTDGWTSAAALPGALIRREPLRARALARALAPALAEEVRSFRPDLVHVVSGRLALVHPVVAPLPTVLTALDAWHRNVEADARRGGLVRRRLLSGEAARVRRFQASAWGRFDRVVMVTGEDADAVRQVAPALAIDVITNGVDLPEVVNGTAVPVDPHRIVFHGVLRYPPNVSAAERLCRRILPLVRREVPDASVALVGRHALPAVAALGALPGVSLVGEVPDVVPWLASGGVYACPMESGTGVKNKVLEAMSARAPVVATSLGLQGLAVRTGEEVLCADDDPGLARAISRVLRDPLLAARLGAAGRAHVEREHRWSSVVARYEALYREVLA